MTDNERLLKLAEWFDMYDAKHGNIGTDEVQTSLREIAKRIESIDSHRLRLIQSVKKWGGAWRKCRAELKEAKRTIEYMESHIRLMEERIIELTQYAHELKTK